jgi:hypothetical protein
MIGTVFLSGSISINRLNDMIRKRLENIIERDLHVAIGDAGGADKAMQTYFAEARYPHVEVFCAGDECRNNVGNWSVRHVRVDPKLKGRELYAQKDKAMAVEADYGFVVWDGKSPGSINNVIELLESTKPVVVYFAPEKQFYPLKRAGDVRALLHHCSEADYRRLNQKIGVERQLGKLNVVPQGSLGF